MAVTVSDAAWRLLTKAIHGRYADQVFSVRRALSRRNLPAPSDASRSLDESFVAQTTLNGLTSANWTSTARRLRASLEGVERSGEHAGDTSDGRSTGLHCNALANGALLAEFPELLQWGTAPAALEPIHRYVGLPLALTDIVARFDIGNDQQVGTRIWHLDSEDVRVVRMIVYLTDVTIDDGPFEYLNRRDTDALSPLLRARAIRAKVDPILNEELETIVPRERWCQALGPAGTVFMADNARLLHHGRVHSSTRLAVFYTYTSRLPRYPKLASASRRRVVRIPGVS